MAAAAGDSAESRRLWATPAAELGVLDRFGAAGLEQGEGRIAPRTGDSVGMLEVWGGFGEEDGIALGVGDHVARVFYFPRKPQGRIY